MKSVIAGLKWLSLFLERRFPERFVPADYILRTEYKAAIDLYSSMLEQNTVDIEKLKEQVQTLNLRVGLARPMQTVLQRSLK